MSRPVPDDEDQRRLVELLRTLGATDDEIERTPPHQRSALALDVVTRHGRPPVPVDTAVEIVGSDHATVSGFWHALGFATEPEAVPAAMVEAQAVLRSSNDLIGEQATLGLARVIGNATARLAEALVDSFRVGFELPELDRGVRYHEVVQQYVEITRAALPAFEALVLATFRAHLVRVAGGAWAPDVDNAAARRELAIGFADLVGYTALSRTMDSAQLATLLRRFEDGVNEVLGRHGGRLVKQIGDGVMFTSERAAAGAAIALDLAAAFPGSDGVPPVRVGLAFGTVLTHYGDYYGEVVNLAARLVALAKPGTVVISDEAARAAGPGVRVQRLPDQALKGFGAPATVYRLVGETGT